MYHTHDDATSSKRISASEALAAIESFDGMSKHERVIMSSIYDDIHEAIQSRCDHTWMSPYAMSERIVSRLREDGYKFVTYAGYTGKKASDFTYIFWGREVPPVMKIVEDMTIVDV